MRGTPLAALAPPLLLAGCAAWPGALDPAARGDAVPASPSPAPVGEDARTLRVASLNVAFVRLPEGRARWEGRREALAAAVRALDADLIALQEAETRMPDGPRRPSLQLEWLLARLPGYAAAATARNGRLPGVQPILYRRARLTVLEEDGFPFPATPPPPAREGVVPPPKEPPAFATLVRFAVRGADMELTALNVHLDLGSPINRIDAGELIAARVAPLVERGEPVVVLGDFNDVRGAPPLRRLAALGLKGGDVLRPTFHFGLGLGVTPAIDHILASPALERIGRARVHARRHGGRFGSDHHPIWATYRLREGDPPPATGGFVARPR